MITTINNVYDIVLFAIFFKWKKYWVKNYTYEAMNLVYNIPFLEIYVQKYSHHLNITYHDSFPQRTNPY